ncbi:MAG: dipeptidase [Bacillota bacterium]
MTDNCLGFHYNALLVDAHCDTLSVLAREGSSFVSCDKGHVDLPRLKQGGVNVQLFAVFVSPLCVGTYLRSVMEQIDVFYSLTEGSGEQLVAVRDLTELRNAIDSEKIAGILSVEGGHMLEGSTGVLRALYQLGVRCLTLTWNGRNELADGVGESETRGGLTSFGRAVVTEMERLGMLIDVSHLAPAGFWDVMRLVRGPVIASHSNSRMIWDHPRNLTDEQVRTLAGTGGVIGVNFVPDFVDPGKPTLDRLIDHIEHIAAVGGVDCVGIGSDFDGAPYMVTGLEDTASFPALTCGLLGRGWREDEVRKVLGDNFLRVINTTWRS